jgi:hypothetical protein
MSDSKPEKRPRVPTDPGLGEPKAITAPGPPPVAPLPVVDRNAPTPPEESPTESPSPRPVAVRLGGEPTPLPPEATEGLLTSLIESESEAYFRREKASESHGESAVAFHGAPHALSPGVATPLPEPAVMLRSSVELDIAEIANAALHDSALEDTRRMTRRSAVSRDPTLTLAPPRSVSSDKWIAFGAAAVIVAAIGIVGVRWAQERTPVAHVGKAAASAPPTPTVPAPMPMPVPEPPTPAATSTPTPDPTLEIPAESKPALTPRALPSASRPPRPAAPPSAAPPHAAPQKDDVKRSM